MDCPGCRQGVLRQGEISEGLEASTCSQCHGSLLAFENYRFWQEKASKYTSTRLKKPEHQEPTTLQPKAILCPKCRRIMRKFRFAWDSWNNLDVCQACEVVWLEEGIWFALESRQIHTQLLTIFTESWQRKIRKDRAENILDGEYRQRFGDADYQHLQQMREWIYGHPKRSEILDFLISTDPYQP